MGTDHINSYTQDTNLDHHNPNSINHPKRKNDLRQTLELNCNENYRHRISESVLVCSMKLIRTFAGNPRKVLRNWYAATTSIFLEAPNNSSWTNTEYQLLISDRFQLLHILTFPYFNIHFPNTPLYALRDISGDDSENSPIFDSGSITEYLQVMLSILRILVGTRRSEETSRRRERAGTRRIATTLQKHAKYRRLRVQKVWLIKMQKSNGKPRWN